MPPPGSGAEPVWGLVANQPGPIDADVDDEDDGDSAVGSEDESATTSLRSSVREYTYENGRRYHAFRAGEYVLPNDEREQDRLDLVHHIFGLSTGGPLFRAPIGKNPQRVLDIGTGTGIWAIAFADEFPSAQVIGTDLSPIQPTWVPPNVKFEVDDAEADWTFPPDHFDFIHARSLGGSISDFGKLYAQCYKHLKPGGWLEVAECDLWPSSDDNSFTPDLAMWKWFNYLDQSSIQIGKRIQVADKHKGFITAAGFVDVQDDVYKNPLGTWPKDKRLKEIGQWIMLAAHEGLEPYSLALLTRVQKWDRARIEAMLIEVRKDLRNRKIHSYFNIHFCYGRKPLTEPSTRTC